MRTLWFIASCAALLAAGCFPYTSEFYHPSADGGTLRESPYHGRSCSSFSGKLSTIEFQRSGVIIMFSAFVSHNYGPLLAMSIILPEGGSAVISPPTALLSTSVHEVSDILTAETYHWYEQGMVNRRPINEPIVGFSYGKTRRIYDIWFVGAKKFPDTFKITPPKILINGELINLPEIKFKWGTSLQIVPINC